MYYKPLPKERSSKLSNTERHWLDVACKLAETSQENQRHGALIISGGAVQSMGINRRSNDPHIHKNLHRLSEHAEMAALRRCRRTQGAIMYIARINRRGDQRMSRPCDKCMRLLKAAGIKKIIYTIDQSEYL